MGDAMLETRFALGERVWIEPVALGPQDGEAEVVEDSGLGYFVLQEGEEWFVTDEEVSPL